MIDKFWQRVKYLQQAYDNSNNDTVKQLYKMKLLDYMLRLEEHEKKEVNLWNIRLTYMHNTLKNIPELSGLAFVY